MNVKSFIGIEIAACAGLACGVANAGGVHFGITVGIPAPVYVAPVYAAPVYAPPPTLPVVYQQPVYAPAPVYAAPAPVIVVGWHGDRY